MQRSDVSVERTPTYCALCTSRCGAIATLEDGRFSALEADPSHPTGQALCIKGKVAPELVYHTGRLLYPMKRTQPKGAADPGWVKIGWEEALDRIAERLQDLAEKHGPETVVFNTASPSTSALSDSRHWVTRLRRAFGSPNQSVSYELCGWGRWHANHYTYGSALPAGVMPDLSNAGCVLFWGYNPSISRIAHATATLSARKRGAQLIVVDPRNAGLAHRADEWLQVRPGSDGALALGLSQVMIERGWYDADFVRAWTNATLLVREDNGRILRASDLSSDASAERSLCWSRSKNGPTVSALGDGDEDRALFGRFEAATLEGLVSCRPVFQRWADVCSNYDPNTVEELTGVPADQISRTAERLWQARPLAYMTWSGLEQQSNATQMARAIGLLYALTGSYDAKGGNVEFPSVDVGDVQGGSFLSAKQQAKILGLADRPLGPAHFDEVNSADIYRAVIDHVPYRVTALVSFGSNLVMAHADGDTAQCALQSLSFHVHADHYINPSAHFADIVLPATTPFESEGLKVGFEISEDACSLIQLRRPLIAPQGESRSDTQIVFDLACRLGLGEKFWNGDIDAAFREMLAPSGVTLEALRETPEGIRVPLSVRYRKFAERSGSEFSGFNTPSRRIELYSERLLEEGYNPLPDYEEPLVSHRRNPGLSADYPLVLTCTKDVLFCESQHRGLPSLRKRARDPQVDLHPQAASARNIVEGDWVRIVTPHGRAKAKARFDRTLAPNVVCGQHGWWQDCPEIGAPGYPPTGAETANFNVVIGHDAVDPVSGSVPMRAYVCQIERIG